MSRLLLGAAESVRWGFVERTLATVERKRMIMWVDTVR